jgi:hypothetical protein
MKVFISYTNPDRDLAERLAHKLARHGLDTWRDKEVMPGDTGPGSTPTRSKPPTRSSSSRPSMPETKRA